MEEKSQNRWVNITIAALAVLNAAVHLIFSYNLEYHRDELLYFSLGQHPAFGYASVPPLIGWIAWTMKTLFGYSLFAVRIFPALMGGVAVFLISAVAKELGGSGFSRILASTGIIFSAFGLRVYLLYQPVHIELILWTLIFYLIIRYINTKSDKYLFLLGIIAGIGLLNKYLIGLLLFLLLITVPFTRYRTIFTRKKFWYGIIACFVLFLPNIVWQVVNGFPVTDHFAELERTQLVNVSRRSFLFDQLIMPGSASLLVIAGIIYLFIDKRVNRFRILGMIALLVVITLMLLKGKSYYTLGVFPLLIAAGSVSLSNLLSRTWSRILLLSFVVIFALPLVPVGIPVFREKGLLNYFDNLKTKYGMSFLCRFEDGSIHSLPQDYADMLGWEELTEIVDKAWKMIPDKKSAIIYGDNYGQAGAVTVIGKKYGLPHAICFSESFRYWIPEKFEPDIKTAVYINDELGEDVQKFFGKITKVGSITNPDAREFGTSVYLCEEPAGSFNKFWTERIKDL